MITFNQLITEVIVAIVIWFLGFLFVLVFKPIRYFLFYRVRRFEIEHLDNSGKCAWDFQLDRNLRLTIKLESNSVHNDHLSNIKMKVNDVPVSIPNNQLDCSTKFVSIPNHRLHIGIDSIVRIDPEMGTLKYLVYLAVRHSRWQLLI